MKALADKHSTMMWPFLGGVRFFLAMIVACSHLRWFVAGSPKILALGYFSNKVAVFGFLFISGFSIANSYVKNRSQFYTRRVLRIIPLYAIAVLLSNFVPLLFGGSIEVSNGKLFQSVPWKNVIANLFFLQGFTTYPLAVNTVVWTLSIEVFFYAVTPLVARLPQWALMTLVSFLAIAFAFSRILPLPHYSELSYGANLVLLGWAWLLGYWSFMNVSKSYWVVAAQSIGIAAIALNNTQLEFLWPVTWMIGILGAGYAALLPWHAKAARFMSLLGDISYPLYLFHIPFGLFVSGFYKNSSVYHYLLVMVLASWMMEACFDRSFKKVLLKSLNRLRGGGLVPTLKDNAADVKGSS